MRIATPSPNRRGSPRQAPRPWVSAKVRCAVRWPRRVGGTVHHVVVHERERLEQLERGPRIDDAGVVGGTARGGVSPEAERGPDSFRVGQHQVAQGRERLDDREVEVGPPGDLLVEERCESCLDEGGDFSQAGWGDHRVDRHRSHGTRLPVTSSGGAIGRRSSGLLDADGAVLSTRRAATRNLDERRPHARTAPPGRHNRGVSTCAA